MARGASTPFTHPSPTWDRRRFLGALALAGAPVFWSGCGPAAPDTRLIVGMDLGFPPFEMRDEQGQPAGVSVDLANALATALKRPLVIENMPFDGLIPALKTGRIHLILSSLTRTEERDRSIDFSNPYAQIGLALLVNKNSPVKSAADLDHPDRTIAVMRGTTGQLYAASKLARAKVLVLEKDAAAVLEVTQGKADAFIFDQIAVYQFWKRNESTTRPLLEPLQVESWAIGLREGDTELKQKVDAFLDFYRAQGGFDQLGEKWLKDQRRAFRELGVPFIF